MPSRPVNTKAIIEDIKSGLGDVPIMEKYQLSPSEYLRVLDKLVAVRAITETTTRERKRALTGQPKSKISTKRRFQRNYALFTITIQDANDLAVAGTLNDITERGLQVAGIPAHLGAQKTFLLRTDVFTVFPPVLLSAVCKWTSTGEDPDDIVAGYEIIGISRHDLKGLRRLIDELTISPLPDQ